MSDDRGADEDYPPELADAYTIEDGVSNEPVTDLLQAVELMLCEKGVFQEPGDGMFPTDTRMEAIGDYISSRSQKELYYEMRKYDDERVSSVAIHLDPAWKPQTGTTYEILERIASIRTAARYAKNHPKESM